MASAAFSDKHGPGGIVHNPASAYSREMAKWEMGWSPYGHPGRPRETVGHQTWPAQYYKVKRSDTNGDFVVVHTTQVQEEQAASFEAQGYRRGRAAAEAFVVEMEQRMAVAAAERNAQDRHMGEKAKAESARAEAETSGHLAEVPVTPLKRRGRPAKVVAVE